MVTKTLEGMHRLPLVSGAREATPGAQHFAGGPLDEVQLEECSTRAGARPARMLSSDAISDLAYSAGVGLVAHLGPQKH